jgi:diguanylate cyclase (GGDEF)-like protein
VTAARPPSGHAPEDADRLRSEHRRLVEENLDLVRAQALFHEALALLSEADGERLGERVLAALSRATDAQGAALWVADGSGALRLRAWRGAVDREALPAALDPAEPALAAALAANAPFADGARDAGESFRVPLLAAGEPVGLAALEAPARGRFGAPEQGAAAGLGRFAAVALRQARRFAELERASLRDRETGAYHLAYFEDHAGKELYKARRYGRPLSIALLAVDGLEDLRARLGDEAVRRAAGAVVAAAGRVVRDADVLARVADGEYHVLLPETDRFGALRFTRRVAEEVRAEPAVRALDGAGALVLTAGSATFPGDGADLPALLHAGRARQEEERTSLARRLHLELGPGGFWDVVDALLGSAPLPEGGPTARLAADAELFAGVQREAARELSRDPRARALLYVGVAGPVAAAPALAALPPLAGAGRAGDTGARAFLLGARGAGPARPHPLVTPVYAERDARLAAQPFLLLRTERAGYALLHGPDGRMVHTCDAPLVEALVARLQAAYELPPL